MLKNSQRTPFLHFATVWDLSETKNKFRQKFRKKIGFFQFFPKAGTVVFVLFLSLRYGADLGRSRLAFLKMCTKFVLLFKLSLA